MTASFTDTSRQPPRMIPSTSIGITFGSNESEIENKDPFVVTPPRKHYFDQCTTSTTPATPRSKSTPLHKRFLEEVTMSPGISCTPPRTPSKSPRRGGRNDQTPKQTLEVGQNGFYFSLEIPEKKITPRRAATPDTKVLGRLTPGVPTPSPDKQKRSEVKAGGRVKDNLRKNLFGTPTKQATKPGMGDQGKPGLEKKDTTVKMSPLKGNALQLRIRDSSESESAQKDALKEAATENIYAPFALQEPSIFSQLSATPASTIAPSKTRLPAMLPDQQQTPLTLPLAPAPTTDAVPGFNLFKTSAASTPSNIGHLMANHSNVKSKVQVPPTTSGLESMPTPLRKMSERLGLKSPNVVRKGKVNENGNIVSPTMLQKETLRSPISSLDLRDAAAVMDQSTVHAAAAEADAKTTLIRLQRGHAMQGKDRLAQLLPSPITTASPVVSQHPNTATTPNCLSPSCLSPSCLSPSTPSRPGPPSRAKSFGTPSRLRSSIQEDMHKVQESLKRSLGPDVFQTNGTRPRTPMSPTILASRPSTSATNHSKSSLKKTTSIVSMAGTGKSDEVCSTQAVLRRPLNTAARKPRPKSMIIGSAKVLEAVASQIDSPRERAKQRSGTATPLSAQGGHPSSRPGTAASISRKSGPATLKLEAPKPQPTVRMTKSAALRAAAHPKRAALPAPTATLGRQKQRVASAEAIANRVGEWKKECAQKAVPKLPVRSKSTKLPNKPALKPRNIRAVKTPEPKDTQVNTKADSATAQSYTPPGNPTRLPSPIKSPTTTRFAVPPTTPAPKPKTKPKTQPLPSHAKNQRIPHQAKTPVSRRFGLGEPDPNAVRTPSREIQNSLDAAIDRKIEEDRRRAGLI